MPAWDLDEPAQSSPEAPSTADVPLWEAGDDGAEPPLDEEGVAATPVIPPTFANSDDELDARIRVLDAYLADMQKPVRAHYFGWMAGQVGLIGMSAGIAAASEGASRSAAIVRAAISGANLSLMIITPQPGWYASTRYRSMPEGTTEEKRAKLAAGHKWLNAQAHVDKRATSPARHVLGAAVALGAGLGIMLAHEDGLREAITTTIGIMLVSEVQIATRPRKPRLYNQNCAAYPSGPVQLSLAPWATQHSRGLGLVGQF